MADDLLQLIVDSACILDVTNHPNESHNHYQCIAFNLRVNREAVLRILGARLETRACTSNDASHRRTWPHAFTEECNKIPAFYFEPRGNNGQ